MNKKKFCVFDRSSTVNVKGFASPMSNKTKLTRGGAGMEGNVKKKLQDIMCLDVRKRKD